MTSPISAKIKKLSKLYDLNKPEDLFVILPQEMEIAEVKGLYKNLNGLQKKKLVEEVILGIAKINSTKVNKDVLSVFIDTINAASKGTYALNKEQS